MKTTLIWATPDADRLIGHIARVSNPENQTNPDVAGLIRYCYRNQHWSPFEMVSACIEIETTRDIARQILRHRSFSFQEFCIAGTSEITLELPGGVLSGKRSAYKRTIAHLYEIQESGRQLPACVRVFDERRKVFTTAPIREIFKTGVKPTFRVTLDNGKSVECTKEHKFLTEVGFASLENAVGLSVTASGKATMSKGAVSFACNGVPAYQDKGAMAAAKEQALLLGTGLQGVCAYLGANVHTVRKWLKVHGLQFTKKEVSAYSPIWNKGRTGYRLPKHRAETIAKMRASARKGSESNLWRGGADRAERLRIADWCNANRADFLRAANYQCARCASSERLELHHKAPVVERPDLAREPSNIEVLCAGCHRAHHKTNGDYKTWRERSVGNTLTTHWSRVVSVEFIGNQMTYDMEVGHDSHNYVANGIVTHNSQRYQDVSKLPVSELRECRLQDTKNRQNSLETDDTELARQWGEAQREVDRLATQHYKWALANGIAKEQARVVLPEGLTTSRLYMAGTLRSWLHYVNLRRANGTQKEHQQIAEGTLDILRHAFPETIRAVGL